jgi:hypothetical protein
MSLDESRYYIMLKHDERYVRATKKLIYEKSFHPCPLFWQELMLEAKYQTTTTGWLSLSRSKEL